MDDALGCFVVASETLWLMIVTRNRMEKILNWNLITPKGLAGACEGVRRSGREDLSRCFEKNNATGADLHS